MGNLRSDLVDIGIDKRKEIIKKVIDLFNKNKVFYWLEFGTLLGCIRDKGFISWDSDADIGVFDIKEIYKLEKKLRSIGIIIKPKNDIYGCKRIILEDVDNPFGSNFHIDIFEFEFKDNHIVYRWAIRKKIIARLTNFIGILLDNNIVAKSGIITVNQMVVFNKIFSFIPRSIRMILKKPMGWIEYKYIIKRMFVLDEFKLIKTKFYDMIVNIPSTYEEHLRVNYGPNWRIPNKDWCDGGSENIFDIVDGVEICRSNVLKLNVGSGYKILPDFINIDRVYNPGVDVVMDFNTEKLPFKDNTIDKIVCSHVLEHVINPYDLVADFHRVLKKDGILEVVLPNSAEQLPHLRCIHGRGYFSNICNDINDKTTSMQNKKMFDLVYEKGRFSLGHFIFKTYKFILNRFYKEYKYKMKKE